MVHFAWLIPSRPVFVFAIGLLLLYGIVLSRARTTFCEDVDALLEVYWQLSLGMHEDEVRAVYLASAAERLRLHFPDTSGIPDAMEITTPGSAYTLGKNWVLYLQFEDKKLVAMRFRVSDHPREFATWPIKAPPDQHFAPHIGDALLTPDRSL